MFKTYIIYFSVLLFSVCASTIRYSSLMCESDTNQDCSFQLPRGKKKDCLVHNTSVCLKNENLYFSKSIEILTSESEANFEVSVYPYSAIIYPIQESLPLSAINITLKIQDQDITGFSIMIRDDLWNITLCRILDFKNYSAEMIVPTIVFYDCFRNMVEYERKHVQMVVKSIPMNKELSYYVFIPSAMSDDLECSWQALIMIFGGSLSKGIVLAKFSQAPTELNITSYIVELVEASENKTIAVEQKGSNVEHNMLYAEFSSVKTGCYYMLIQTENLKCLPTKTAVICVTNQKLDEMLVLYICIVLFFSLSIIYFMKCSRTHKQADITSKPVLLVYSYDCIEHEQFISLFSTYLTTECHMNVSTIYGKTEDSDIWVSEAESNTKNPDQSIKDQFKEAEAVIFIVSEGLFLTLGRSNIQLKEGHPWCNRLPRAVAYIRNQIYNSDENASPKKFCKVVFPYANKKHIPSRLKDMGRCYELPKEFNNFLNFIFNTKTLLPIVLQKFPGSSLHSRAGKNMLDGLKAVQKAVDTNTHISVIETQRTSYEKEHNEIENLGSSVSDFKLMENCEFLKSDNEISSQNDISDPILDDWKNYLKAVQINNSGKVNSNNYMTELVKQEFNDT